MTINVSKLTEADLAGAVAIWNEIVEEGLAFPQEESLTLDSGRAFFAEQSFTGGAYDSGNGEMVGMYILHPNNVGRCGHICNASYAVKWTARGKHVGEALVRHCLRMGRNWAMVCSSSMLWSQPMNVLYAFIRNLVSPNSVLFQRDSVTKTVITKTLFHIITNCKGGRTCYTCQRISETVRQYDFAGGGCAFFQKDTVFNACWGSHGAAGGTGIRSGGT